MARRYAHPDCRSARRCRCHPARDHRERCCHLDDGAVFDPVATCPWALTCPDCKQGPGSPCRRPSEHDCVMHAARWRLAERLDDQAGAAWTLEPDNRRAAGLAARPAPTAWLAGPR